MTRNMQSSPPLIKKVATGLLAVIGVCGIGLLPSSCQTGGVGDPCTPEDEYNPIFAGFKVTEDNIESRSFQCQTRICLVNHFQGRVTCPLGQAPPTPCTGDADCAASGAGFKCVQADTFAPFCATTCAQDADCAIGATCKSGKCTSTGCESLGPGFSCHESGHFCACGTGATCPTGYTCGADQRCVSSFCHKDGNCQVAGTDTKTAAANAGKECCVPGQNGLPIATSVCGQCGSSGGRNAENAVYCSCRCGEPLDAKGNELPRDPNFNYCSCPDGFECKEIRKYIGIGDKQLAGQYCVKGVGTASTFTTASEAGAKCGDVKGFFSSTQCNGTPSL